MKTNTMENTLFTQMQENPDLRPPPSKHACQGKIYLSKSKMTHKNKSLLKKILLTSHT